MAVRVRVCRPAPLEKDPGGTILFRLLLEHEFRPSWAGPSGYLLDWVGLGQVLQEAATLAAVNAMVHVIHNHPKRLLVQLRVWVG